jgi:hypothetical protein
LLIDIYTYIIFQAAIYPPPTLFPGSTSGQLDSDGKPLTIWKYGQESAAEVQIIIFMEDVTNLYDKRKARSGLMIQLKFWQHIPLSSYYQ